jgi:hypothetical protein
MPYKTGEYLARDILTMVSLVVSSKEGTIFCGQPKWSNVNFDQVVVFGRSISGDSSAMQISIADSKRVLNKEKKNAAFIIFSCKTSHPLVRALTVVPVEKRAPIEWLAPYYV